MRVFGTIENAYTDKLVKGAIVTLEVGDTELIEFTPAKEGTFDYDFPDEKVPRDGDELTCIIEKKGYKTSESHHSLTGSVPGSGKGFVKSSVKSSANMATLDGKPRGGRNAPKGIAGKVAYDDIRVDVQLVPRLVNWGRIFKWAAIILGGLLLLGLLYFGIKHFFFGPKVYPIVTFTAEPTCISAGEEAELKWETKKAEAVFLDGKEVEPSGTLSVTPPHTRSYILEVTDKKGRRDAREKIEIKVLPPPPVIVTFTAKVYNIGNLDIEDDVIVNIYDSNIDLRIINFSGIENVEERLESELIFSQNLGPMQVGDFRSIEFDWQVTEGVHTINAFVDPDNVIYESVNEINNICGVSFTCLGESLPDLHILTLNLNGVERSTQSTYIQGEVELLLENRGTSDINDSFKIVVYEDKNSNRTFESYSDNLLGETLYDNPIPGRAQIPVASRSLVRRLGKGDRGEGIRQDAAGSSPDSSRDRAWDR